MNIDELVKTPEWLEAAEQTKREFGIDKPRPVKPNPFPSGIDLGMGETITRLKIDEPD
jgi:hypothetical protein